MHNIEPIPIDSIPKFNVEELPNSSFNVAIGRRRSGKSYLIDDIVNKMIKAKMVDCVFLFTATDAGFSWIEPEFRFDTIEPLEQLVENYRWMNEYNKVAPKKDQIKIKTVVIIDDMATKLKAKECCALLSRLATNGRHVAYAPLSLHFFILSQSLTLCPRTTRLNTDVIFCNSIASVCELEMILDETWYVCDSSRDGKKQGRKLYNDLCNSKDFLFCCIENHRQNCRSYSDYIKTHVADAKPEKK